MLEGPPMPRPAIPLPVLRPQAPLVECTECARCCTYVGVGINPPTTPRLATDVLWYLYHERVSVYADEGGEWSVLFETRCRNLRDDRRCDVYAARPHICRGFSNRACDVNAPSPRALTFREPEEFLAWLEATRPRLHARIEAGFVPDAWRAGAEPRQARAGRAVARRARS
jgi:Fe-S-cluster containining protein